jgi:hypothetical protein
MTEFFLTRMGVRFYESTMPELVKQLADLNENLRKQREGVPSEPHKVSGPSTVKEIMASDNRVIRENMEQAYEHNLKRVIKLEKVLELALVLCDQMEAYKHRDAEDLVEVQLLLCCEAAKASK